MLLPDSGKRDLRELLTQAAALRARLPASARALARALGAWEADGAARLGALVLRIKSADIATLRARLTELTQLADDLAGLLGAAEQWQRAESAFAAERAGQPDLALAAWFAARADPRLTRLANAAVTVDDEAGLAAVREALTRDAEQRDFDRQLFDLFVEAAERTRPFADGGGAAPIRTLADALPGWRRRLLDAARPERELVLALREAVAAARALAARPKPPQLDECFALIEGLTAWVEVLRDGREPGTGTQPDLDRAERALQDLSSRYGQLAQHWQQQEEGAFAALIDAATRLEGGLLALAKAEQGVLTARLERSRALFQQYSDPSLSPGLGERIGGLLAATPDSPAGFQVWRERCRRAEDDFERAIGADSHRLEARCDERAEAIRQGLEALEHGPLGAAGRADGSQLRRRLDGLAVGPGQPGGVTALLGLLADLGALQAEVAALAGRVAARVARVAARRQWLARRAARLAALVDGLAAAGLPVVIQPPAAAAAPGNDLDQARRDLAAWRGRLLGAELALLGQIAAPLVARSNAWRALYQALDADLAAGIPPLAAPGATRPGLATLVPLIGALPAAELALDQALHLQAGRLRPARQAAHAALARADAAAWSAPERAAAARLLETLAREPASDAPPRQLVPAQRAELAEAEALVGRLAQAQQLLDRLSEHLGQRLARLRRDAFELDATPTSGGVLAECAWALLQPIPGLTPSASQRRDQLREVDGLLAALERHARRVIALRLEQALARLGGHPDAAALRAALAADPLAVPGVELRRQVYQLAEASALEADR